MKFQKFKCYIWGRNSDWEAICTDLDIAVQGQNYNETKLLLNDAISGFLSDIEELPEVDRNRLLNRKVPSLLRAGLRCRLYSFKLRKKFPEVLSREQQDSFRISFLAL